MAPVTPRVAVMLELDRGYARHTRIFAGVQAYAQEHGWDLLVDEAVDETLPAHRGKPMPYDGVIARATPALARCAARLSLPVVNVWHGSRCRDALPGVFRDDILIGRMAAEHLLAQGHVRFATLFTSAASHRLAGASFRKTVADAGYPCSTQKVSVRAYQSRKARQAITEWLDQLETPFGLCVCADEIAHLVAQVCRHLGYRIPEDVAIIGTGNEVLFCEYCRPKLSSVDPGYETIGRAAAKLLEGLMHGDPPPAAFIRVPPLGIAVRESTDFMAVPDDMVASALSFIAANSHRPIGQEDVANAVHAEVRTLQNRFRKFLGRPVVAEIRRLRIERAKRELVYGKRPIAEIARRVGFGTSAQMSQVFQREVGMSPSAYRKQGDS